ncbi:hypothetical protein DUNSADRAFT_9430, partial [Dunaliella salina]
ALNFTDGAAQGGLILCEQDLAEKAAEKWASTRPPQLDPPKHSANHVIKEKIHHTSRPGERPQRQSKSLNGGPPWDEPGPSTAPECFRQQERHSFSAMPASCLSEPIFQLPQQKAESPGSEIQRGGSGADQLCRGNIHVCWLGWFSFKGTRDRKMVYMLQERLAPRIYYPKSLNSFVATMVSHIQPKGPSRRTYLVPMPVLDPQVSEEPLLPIRSSASLSSNFEDSQHGSELLGASFSSWQGASQGASSTFHALTGPHSP